VSWPLLLRSLVATSAVRQPIRGMAQSYLNLPPNAGRDRIVLPAIQAYLNVDRAMMKPVDTMGARDPMVEMAMERFSARKKAQALKHQTWADIERGGGR
jgi:hypothetical protein